MGGSSRQELSGRALGPQVQGGAALEPESTATSAEISSVNDISVDDMAFTNCRYGVQLTSD